jgi:hypothetical protein
VRVEMCPADAVAGLDAKSAKGPVANETSAPCELLLVALLLEGVGGIVGPSVSVHDSTRRDPAAVKTNVPAQNSTARVAAASLLGGA